MHGVPESLDLVFLHGCELVQVCLGQFQLQFHFHPVGSIYVEGRWELRNEHDEVIDATNNDPERPPYQFQYLLGRCVTGTEISPPTWVEVRFENEMKLRLFDEADYESIQIQPGNIIV